MSIGFVWLCTPIMPCVKRTTTRCRLSRGGLCGSRGTVIVLPVNDWQQSCCQHFEGEIRYEDHRIRFDCPVGSCQHCGSRKRTRRQHVLRASGPLVPLRQELGDRLPSWPQQPAPAPAVLSLAAGAERSWKVGGVDKGQLGGAEEEVPFATGANRQAHQGERRRQFRR